MVQLNSSLSIYCRVFLSVVPERRDAAVGPSNDLHPSIDLGLAFVDAVVMPVASLAGFPLDRVDSFWKWVMGDTASTKSKRFLFTATMADVVEWIDVESISRTACNCGRADGVRVSNAAMTAPF